MDGKAIGGRGRLTHNQIDKITTYYENVIRRNINNLTEMRKAIYFHKRSSDDNPKHYLC